VVARPNWRRDREANSRAASVNTEGKYYQVKTDHNHMRIEISALNFESSRCAWSSFLEVQETVEEPCSVPSVCHKSD
jgi:hypothetical protein